MVRQAIENMQQFLLPASSIQDKIEGKNFNKRRFRHG